MPYIETPNELADELADLVGVYGAHPDGAECVDLRKMCRMCFVDVVSNRIRASVKGESDMKMINTASRSK